MNVWAAPSQKKQIKREEDICCPRHSVLTSGFFPHLLYVYCKHKHSNAIYANSDPKPLLILKIIKLNTHHITSVVLTLGMMYAQMKKHRNSD